MFDALLELDRDAAKTLFGPRRDRPTISQHVGEMISSVTPLSPQAGKVLFHAALLYGAYRFATRDRPSMRRPVRAPRSW